MRYLLISLCFACYSHTTVAQAASYSDPAAAYLKVMLEKGGEGTYQQIGSFKVIGTSYLFGDKLIGNVYAGKEKSENVSLGYNMYKQELDLYTNPAANAKISRPAASIDSFVVFKSQSEFLTEDLLFYSSSLLQSDLKACFLQVVCKGKRYTLFKAYSAVFDYVSTNYIQSDLRQFSIEYNYYYLDMATRQLKKLKLSRKKMMDEFKSVKDIGPYYNNETFDLNPEQSLKTIFNVLNAQ